MVLSHLPTALMAFTKQRSGPGTGHRHCIWPLLTSVCPSILAVDTQPLLVPREQLELKNVLIERVTLVTCPLLSDSSCFWLGLSFQSASCQGLVSYSRCHIYAGRQTLESQVSDKAPPGASCPALTALGYQVNHRSGPCQHPLGGQHRLQRPEDHHPGSLRPYGTQISLSIIFQKL